MFLWSAVPVRLKVAYAPTDAVDPLPAEAAFRGRKGTVFAIPSTSRNPSLGRLKKEG
jgi:hypothetical protein